MNILILTGVPWNFIKQRPHFMAEYLDKTPGYTVTYLYWGSLKLLVKKQAIKNQSALKKPPKSIFRLPFDRIKIIRSINRIIVKIIMRHYLEKNDIIIISNPSLFQYIENCDKPVLYDCMDDMIEFPTAQKIKNEIEFLETKLIKKAALTLFTAEYLQKVVQERAGFDFNSIILNNAIHISGLTTEQPPYLYQIRKKGKKNITYIGGISEWFDYQTLKDAAEKYTSIVFNLFGPVEGKFPACENIVFWGPQKHDDIFHIMREADALIMPFRLNKLIVSVNPIKLYEYIYSGKPVVSIRYGETERFSNFVYLYESGSVESLGDVIETLQENGWQAKRSFEESRAFALENTWENRIKTLLPYIERCVKK